jgi:glutathione synthase/RimK-type ligase-like ATP-grasp enzyme
MSRKRVVGLLVGRENTFPEPFLAMVNERGRADDVTAELAVLGGTAEIQEPYHAVLVDRISHEIPYYRAHLKSAALLGTVVINDPFWWEADEKFFECTLARKLGVAVPKTLVLPNKQYIPDIDHQRSLRNLQYPLDWEALVAYTGLPAVLKPNTGGGWKDVSIVDSLEQLVTAYDQSGLKTMILQEFIAWDDYVRCICIGRQEILPLRYDPRAPFEQRYVTSRRPVEGRLRERAVRDARVLVEALGYDMDTVEFAVKNDTLYAIDFLNPAPDFDNFSIKEENFQWVLERMTDLVLKYALGKATAPWRNEHRWWKYLQDPSEPENRSVVSQASQ